MSNRKLNKVKGAVETCHCGTKIFCNEKPASGNYPAKLQWQNNDGNAHYNYDFKTGATTCNAKCQACNYTVVLLDEDHTKAWKAHLEGHNKGNITHYSEPQKNEGAISHLQMLARDECETFYTTCRPLAEHLAKKQGVSDQNLGMAVGAIMHDFAAIWAAITTKKEIKQ